MATTSCLDSIRDSNPALHHLHKGRGLLVQLDKKRTPLAFSNPHMNSATI